MKKTPFAVVLIIAMLAVSAFAQNARTTRYWDACKPSCSWTSNAGGVNNACIDCNRTGGTHTRGSDIRNICGGGGNPGESFTCFFHAPFTVGDHGYAFAASHERCGTCWELTFLSTSNGGGNPQVPQALRGKKMTVMVSNVGDIGRNHFDIMIPGGGEGEYVGFFGPQITANGGTATLGAVRGGFATTCSRDRDCIKRMCDEAFSSPALSAMRQGCHWYVDWFEAADNPDVTFRSVSCPPELTSRYAGTTTTYGGGSIQQPTTRTISFDANGGTGTMSSETVNNGANYAIKANTFTRANHTFAGWNTNAAGTGTNYAAGATINNVTANITLFARWTAATTSYTVRYNINSGTGTTPAAQTVNAGSSVTLASNNGFTRSNFTFGGWNTNANGNGTNHNAGASFTPTADITLYARWVPVTNPVNYTVTYNVNGGTGTTPAAQTVNAGSSVTLASGSGLTRSNFTFGGWNTNANGNGTNYNAGVAFTPTANTPLYARWISNSGVTTRMDTTKVEAESLTESLPTCNSSAGSNPMCVSTANGITNIGWITNGNSANYAVTVPQAGTYTVVFRVATAQQSSFTVTVNNGSTIAGTININTNDWDTYQHTTLSSTVQLNAGNNAVRLNFQGPMNVDYFLLITEVQVITSVKFNAARVNNTRSNVVLRPANRGFGALLPNNHAFESYSLVDLQGREIRKGNVPSGVAELHFNDIRQSVLFLRLKDKNGTTVLKATTF